MTNGRLTVFRHGGAWSWLCGVCAASESGFHREHHARTLGECHVLAHDHDELDGGSVLVIPPPVFREPDLAHRQAVARARLKGARA